MNTRIVWIAPLCALALGVILVSDSLAQSAPSGTAGQADSAAQADTNSQADTGAQSDTSAQSESSADSQVEAQSQSGASADADANANQDADPSVSGSADQTGSQSDAQGSAEADAPAEDAAVEARGRAQTDTSDRQDDARQNDARRGLPAPNQAGADARTQDRDTRRGARTRTDANVDDTTDIDANADIDADANVDVEARQRSSRDRDARDRDGRRDFRGAIRFGRATRGGLVINTVVRDSIFFRAGLRQGDIIVAIDGRPIRSEADFYRWVVYEPGARVPVIVLRDGRRETIYVTYEERMADADVIYDEQPVADLQGYLGVSFDASVQDAAIVTVVAPNSPADHAGLQEGDMIVALNGQPVGSYQDAIEIISSMRPGDRLGIEFARRQDDSTQAILASKPGQAPRAAALPRGEVRVYEDGRQNISIEENDFGYREQNDRRLLNRQPAERRSGNRPLLPRLRN